KQEIVRRLSPLTLTPAREAEIVQELTQHLEDVVTDALTRGATPEQAHALAALELDGSDALAAALRGVERTDTSLTPAGGGDADAGPLAALGHDIRYALRGLRQRPGFTLLAIVTLALGIGATTTLFGVVDAVLLQPMGFPHPEQIITFFGTSPEKGLAEVAYPDGLFQVFHDRSRSMQSMAAWSTGGTTLTGYGDPELLRLGLVSADFFRVLATRPLLGRTFVPDDARSDTAGVAVLSHALWQRQFGGDSAVIGRTIRLDNFPTAVVGVMPAGFDFPEKSEVWLPLRIHPASFNCWCLHTIARLASGQTADNARVEVDRMSDAFATSRRDIFPDHRPGGMGGTVALSLLQRTVGNVRLPLVVVLAAGGFVLLIACANIATLLLARAAARQRELSVRCCLGASRWRIGSQLLTESFVLAGAGALGGILLSIWGIGALRHLGTDTVPRIDQVHIDPLVLGFGIALAFVTGLVFGLAPALRASHVDLQLALKDGSRGSASAGRSRLSDAFVVAQFAVSLVLLISAGLTLRSFRNLLAVDPGYRVQHVVLARVPVPYPRYANDTVVRVFYDRLLDGVRSIPGVRAVGIANLVPLAPGNTQSNVIAEGQEPRPGEPVLVANIRTVTPQYFETIGTPLRAGRTFTEGDRIGAPHVAVIDESFAHHFWPGENSLGKRFHVGRDTTTSVGRWITVVGVVPNIKHGALDEKSSLQVYVPFAQNTQWNDYLVVRSALPLTELVPSLRTTLAALDPLIPLYDVQTMQAALDQSLAARRITDMLLLVFAVAALLLAAIGIYGVVSIGVNARVQEFGVRLALGAQQRDLLRMVLGHGAFLAALGIVLGLVGTFWLTRFLQTLLFGVGRFDAVTLALGVVVLTAASLAASSGPARRAARADVVRALKAE
ncbi:MAG TPA: ABC transporter permease, partial [Gemmatimonadales bacterium]|nr:ABC transporter permease [Gemmatimonadales bacterium]